jgi:hypothetical protein
MAVDARGARSLGSRRGVYQIADAVPLLGALLWVLRHVAAAAKNGDVAPRVIGRISISVVALSAISAAHRARPYAWIEALRARPAALR